MKWLALIIPFAAGGAVIYWWHIRRNPSVAVTWTNPDAQSAYNQLSSDFTPIPLPSNGPAIEGPSGFAGNSGED